MEWRPGIKEVEIEGELISFKKSFFGWKVVYPVKDKDGKWIWENLIAGGSWWNLAIIGFILFVILGAMDEYANAIELATKCLQALPDYIQLFP